MGQPTKRDHKNSQKRKTKQTRVLPRSTTTCPYSKAFFRHDRVHTALQPARESPAFPKTAKCENKMCSWSRTFLWSTGKCVPNKYGKTRLTRWQVDLFCANTICNFISHHIWALAEFAQFVCDEIPCHHMSILKNVQQIIIWILGSS